MHVDFEQFIHAMYKGLLGRVPEAGSIEHWSQRHGNGTSLESIVAQFVNSEEFARLRSQRQPASPKLFVPPGHFYSPVVAPDEVLSTYAPDANPEHVVAFDVAAGNQLLVWERLRPHLQSIPFGKSKSEGFNYHFDNPAFGCGDGSILHAMLREHRPKRLVEVGSGYSSACALDTIDHFLGGAVDVTFIEPYPALLNQLVGSERLEKCHICASGVQQADASIFDTLDAGDFLFIDSTHVMKTGSDVCHELFNILPKLKPGVFIHFHDVFWPFEYPHTWVIDENRSWNELYGLRAFLMYNDTFKVEFFNDFFVRKFHDRVLNDYPEMLSNSGASLWLRKTR